MSASKIGLRWGLLTGAALVVLGVLFQLFRLYEKPALALVFYALLAACIVLAHRAFKAAGDGTLRYGQGLGIGALLSVLAGALYGVFVCAYTALVSDASLQWAKEQQLAQLEAQKVPPEQAEAAMALMEKLLTPVPAAILTFAQVAIFGVILSLIVAAFTRRRA